MVPQSSTGVRPTSTSVNEEYCCSGYSEGWDTFEDALIYEIGHRGEGSGTSGNILLSKTVVGGDRTHTEE